MDVLVVIAVILGVQLLVIAAAVVVFFDYARRAINLLYDIRERASFVSDEHLPAIRSITSDVLDVLVPPGGER